MVVVALESLISSTQHCEPDPHSSETNTNDQIND